ncbi:hypothetical protein EDEG_01599 [Edhazardia aedis USNM 41457]|uniref:Peptidase S8/S53 domain-containing protein n=1 Tax=Edhazardia aedis (strain USNM 41457) TaxID=1003232 RepID=J9D9F4_EDHAE|nr:hypothetical protein EDEG_01599 [Edhazardia aedis USNM 41457]|eukprot:EJW04119.1 hypothetical protein EDEG_01599 [Edhazardia aedis USNM 41457]
MILLNVEMLILLSVLGLKCTDSEKSSVFAVSGAVPKPIIKEIYEVPMSKNRTDDLVGDIEEICRKSDIFDVGLKKFIDNEINQHSKSSYIANDEKIKNKNTLENGNEDEEFVRNEKNFDESIEQKTKYKSTFDNSKNIQLEKDIELKKINAKIDLKNEMLENKFTKLLDTHKNLMKKIEKVENKFKKDASEKPGTLNENNIYTEEEIDSINKYGPFIDKKNSKNDILKTTIFNESYTDLPNRNTQYTKNQNDIMIDNNQNNIDNTIHDHRNIKVDNQSDTRTQRKNIKDSLKTQFDDNDRSLPIDESKNDNLMSKNSIYTSNSPKKNIQRNDINENNNSFSNYDSPEYTNNINKSRNIQEGNDYDLPHARNTSSYDEEVIEPGNIIENNSKSFNGNNEYYNEEHEIFPSDDFDDENSDKTRKMKDDKYKYKYDFPDNDSDENRNQNQKVYDDRNRNKYQKILSNRNNKDENKLEDDIDTFNTNNKHKISLGRKDTYDIYNTEFRKTLAPPADGNQKNSNCYIATVSGSSTNFIDKLKSLNATLLYRYTNHMNGISFCLEKTGDLEDIISKGFHDQIEPDYEYKSANVQNDIPEYMFNMKNYRNKIFTNRFLNNFVIKLLQIKRLFKFFTAQYEYKYTGKNVGIYMLDTSVDIKHPDIKERVQNVFNNNLGCEMHGTYASVLIAGKKHGFAKKSHVRVLNVVDCEGKSRLSDILYALDTLKKNHNYTEILYFGVSGPKSEIFNNIIDNLSKNNNLIIVTPAGNKRDLGCNYSPGSAISAINVGSLDINSQISLFSNFNSCIRIFALGENITISDSEKGYSTKVNGTSFSAAIVVGTIALYLEQNPHASIDDVWTYLNLNSDMEDGHLILKMPNFQQNHNNEDKKDVKTVESNTQFVYNKYFILMGIILIVLISIWLIYIYYQIYRTRESRRNRRDLVI